MLDRRAILSQTMLLGGLLFLACKDSVTHLPLDTGSQASVALSGMSGCRGEVMDLASASREDELAVTLQGGQVRFIHRGAVFNCCLDSVSLELRKYEDVLRVVETAHVNQPCRCQCTFELQGEIADLESGEYWLEVASRAEGNCAFCRVRISVR